jgi:AcrR family transcriptional regulator
MQANERIRVQPMTARGVLAVDQRHLNVLRLGHERVSEGETARPRSDDQIVGLYQQAAPLQISRRALRSTIILFGRRRIARSFLYTRVVTIASPTRTKGERTRAGILDEAARLATLAGLEGLSIGQLARATGMSKSGLYAHFGSKLDLQLATIEAARQTFVAEVLRPALGAPKGIERLLAACAAFLSHVERRVFPGGCFFSAAAADVGTRQGPVHDAIVAQRLEWLALLERLACEAAELGELEPSLDPVQLAFELQALLAAANTSFVLQGDPGALERARTAIHARLRVAGPESARVLDPAQCERGDATGAEF